MYNWKICLYYNFLNIIPTFYRYVGFVSLLVFCNGMETSYIYYIVLAEVTTSTNVIVVHLYVEAPPADFYALMNSYLDNDPFCGENVTVDSNSTDVNATSSDNSTVCDWLGPFVNFTADFTSYFIGMICFVYTLGR